MTHSEKKILLTGASGFIGSQVLAELLRRGYNVHATVHSSELPVLPGLTVHRLNLLDYAAVADFMARECFTHLLHLAWYVGKKCQMNELNVEWLGASLRLLQSFVRHGGEHFLGVGSCSEYEYKYGLLREDVTPTNSGTLYGTAKDTLSRVGSIFCEQSAVRFDWVRVFNCYGPREKPQRLMPSVILACLRGEDVRVSDCLKFQDYLYAEDAARGIVDVFESELSGVVNICSGVPVQLRTIVEKIAELTGFRRNILWGAIPSAFNECLVVGDNARLCSVGWKPMFDLETGLAETINWWQRHV